MRLSVTLPGRTSRIAATLLLIAGSTVLASCGGGSATVPLSVSPARFVGTYRGALNTGDTASLVVTADTVDDDQFTFTYATPGSTTSTWTGTVDAFGHMAFTSGSGIGAATEFTGSISAASGAPLVAAGNWQSVLDINSNGTWSAQRQ